MNQRFQFVNLNYLEEISGGDLDFKKELIRIFLHQIPEFLSNMNMYLSDHQNENLAKEAHTAKSSVLIFMMNEAGADLKQIQIYAAENNLDKIPRLIKKVELSLESAFRELSAYLVEMEMTPVKQANI
jgi:HPt (histidine-containing phosphotransfer) domain-containing protein